MSRVSLRAGDAAQARRMADIRDNYAIAETPKDDDQAEYRGTRAGESDWLPNVLARSANADRAGGGGTVPP